MELVSTHMLGPSPAVNQNASASPSSAPGDFAALLLAQTDAAPDSPRPTPASTEKPGQKDDSPIAQSSPAEKTPAHSKTHAKTHATTHAKAHIKSDKQDDSDPTALSLAFPFAGPDATIANAAAQTQPVKTPGAAAAAAMVLPAIADAKITGSATANSAGVDPKLVFSGSGTAVDKAANQIAAAQPGPASVVPAETKTLSEVKEGAVSAESAKGPAASSKDLKNNQPQKSPSAGLHATVAPPAGSKDAPAADQPLKSSPQNATSRKDAPNALPNQSAVDFAPGPSASANDQSAPVANQAAKAAAPAVQSAPVELLPNVAAKGKAQAKDTSDLSIAQSAKRAVSAKAETENGKFVKPSDPAKDDSQVHDSSKKQTAQPQAVVANPAVQKLVHEAGVATPATQIPGKTDSPGAALTTLQDTVSDSHHAASADASPAFPAVLLQSARLQQDLNQSELRVGMQMGDLGSVEIRTLLHHQQLRAEISVEHSQLSHAISAELPALQQRLQDQASPLASLIMRDNSGGAGQFQQGSQRQFSGQASSGGQLVSSVSEIVSPAEEALSLAGALDIRI